MSGSGAPLGAEPACGAEPAREGESRRRRLHPLTSVLRAAYLWAWLVGAISWAGYEELGPARWAVLVAALVVVAIAVAAVGWLTTGYQLLGQELRVYEGLLWRRTRAVPLRRLQAVDVVRPLLARLLGLSELRLEVVGGEKPEAPLAYLGMAEAARLRALLLARAEAAGADAGIVGTPTGAGVGEAAAASERPLHATENRLLLLSQLLTPQAAAAPLALLAIVAYHGRSWDWSLVAVGSFVTAVVGVLLVPARRVLTGWNFRIAVGPTGLRLRGGLLDTRSRTVPSRRVQGVALLRPLLWRRLGWVSGRLDVAGYGEPGDGEAEAGAGELLLPVADEATARRVVGEVLGVDVAALRLAPAPRRARWLAPLSWRRFGIGWTDPHSAHPVVAASDGWLSRRLVVVPLPRVQSVRVVQGPVQRLLGLASVHVDNAGSLAVVGAHRGVEEAYAMADALAAGARVARDEASPGSAGRGGPPPVAVPQ